MADKYWTDQPDEIAEMERVGYISLGDKSAAIYKPYSENEQDAWLVTIGNLFSSQTLVVPDAEHALRLLSMVEGRRPMSVPKWARLVS